MRDFVLVQFIAPIAETGKLTDNLRTLSEDFSHTAVNFDVDGMVVVSGKIASEYATVITLQNKYLSSRMHISYISDELKDKYRK